MPLSDKRQARGASEPRTIGFLLLDDFALMSFASAAEPLRAANVLAGRALYRWRYFSVGQSARASNGLVIPADEQVGADDVDLDTLIVCAGGNPAAFSHQPTIRWLRRLARRGLRLGAVSGAPFILARAGLLDGYRCTIHWEHLASFKETFPKLNVTGKLYEIDRDRLTCAGGIAALEMSHALIARDHGLPLAHEVAEWFLQPHVRSGAAAQRRSLQARFGVSNPKLLAALELIDKNIERPSSRQELAEAAGVSLRQLERLFIQNLGVSIEKHRRRAQLSQARSLLRQSAMSVVEVAMACGFSSATHFSREYKAAFGRAPRYDRQTHSVQRENS